MSIDAPLAKAGDCSPKAHDPPLAAAGGRLLIACNPPSAGSTSNCQPEPVLERQNRRIAGVQRQYVVAQLFPSLTDMGGEDDGVDFAGEKTVVGSVCILISMNIEYDKKTEILRMGPFLYCASRESG